MPQIICRDASLGYDGVGVCEHLDFTVNEGDYLCIVGANGSGKSTLIKTLLGLRAPLRGEIVRDTGMNIGEIGYLPQQSDIGQDFPATVREVVISGCASDLGRGFFYARRHRELAEQSMSTMNITELSGKRYSELSGGRQQRVLLARALCAAKKTLLLDEPVSGLDPAAATEMYSVIKHLNSHGITVIMVTHDIDSAVKYATKILHMGERPEFFHSVEEYKDSEYYLGGACRD